MNRFELHPYPDLLDFTNFSEFFFPISVSNTDLFYQIKPKLAKKNRDFYYINRYNIFGKFRR